MLGLSSSGFEFSHGEDIFSSDRPDRPYSLASFIFSGRWPLSGGGGGVKRPGRAGDSSPISSGRVEKMQVFLCPRCMQSQQAGQLRPLKRYRAGEAHRKLQTQ
jgi:hypothetical protein